MTTDASSTSVTQPHVPQVSIGMPVYNGEPFIRKALDSLLAQSFTDFELIISDNASNDGTEAICRAYAAKDERIRYVRQAENLGAMPNFQFALREALGTFFMWAAADDRWSANYVADCVRTLQTYENIGFVATNCVIVSRLSRLLRVKFPGLYCVTEKSHEARVLSYIKMPLNTHKDNLVYSVWRTSVIRRVSKEVQEILGVPVVGNVMNVYALGLYKGEYLDSVFFEKTYKYAPPGHWAGPAFDKLSLMWRKLIKKDVLVPRGKQEREKYLSNLKKVLLALGYDSDYIRRVDLISRSYLFR